METRRGSLRSFRSDADEASVDDVATVKTSIRDYLELISTVGFLTSKVEMKLSELGSSSLECKSTKLEISHREQHIALRCIAIGIAIVLY